VSESTKLEIRPTIRGSEIVSIEVENETLALKRPIPLEEFPKFIEMLESISKYIDFKGEGGWTYDDVELLLSSISDNAGRFFEILASEGTWVAREFILDELDLTPNTLAGTLSSPGQFFSKFRMEPIYDKEWRHMEKGWDLCYKIKGEYLEMMRSAFKNL